MSSMHNLKRSELYWRWSMPWLTTITHWKNKTCVCDEICTDR
jgi:hypothetical protein